MSGIELLSEYKQSKSEEAFAELVRGWSGFVFGAAKRRLGNSQVAEEVTQTVFLRLAQAAPRVGSDAQLAAWLHRTTLHVSVDAWRAETRRRNREEKAAAMEPAPSELPPQWEEIAPQLDGALDQLGDGDREALLLRFIQQKSMREVGSALGVSEDAAKMRVSRALGRLRARLALPAGCTAGALGTLLGQGRMEAAPERLIETLTSPGFLRLASQTSAVAAGTAFIPALVFMTKGKIAVLLLVTAIGVAVYTARQRGDSVSVAATNVVVLEGTGADGLASAPEARRFGSVAGAPDGADPVNGSLDDAKRALRQMLQQPPYGKSYPPQELVAVLGRFAGRYEEALPILLEAAERPDHETRAWAISGITHLLQVARAAPGAMYEAEQLFASARPLLSQVLQNSGEPNLLRSLVLGSYLPPPIWRAGQPVMTFAPSVEAVEDLLGALRATGKKPDGFNFSIVDQLSIFMEANPGQSERFAPAMRALLKEGDEAQKQVAAFALATWPGPKPTEVKEVLLRELETRSAHSYRAAEGLGKLGGQAADAVPQLLAYAQKTDGWGSGGYAEKALTAACLIQPELRREYPEIDAKLKAEEEARAARVNPESSQIVTPESLAADLADPKKAADLKESFLSAGPESAEAMLGLLARASHYAGPEQQVEIEELMRAMRQGAAKPPEAEPERRAVPLVSILLDARVLLVDNPGNPREGEIEAALEEFHEARKEEVTAENFRQLSERLRRIDPEFQASWERQVFKTYPWLDRVVESDSPGADH